MLSSPASPSTLGPTASTATSWIFTARHGCSRSVLTLNEAIDVRFPNANIVDVRYESFVADPESTLRGILDRLGLEFEPAVLDPTRDASIQQTPSFLEAKKKVHNQRTERWRRYEKHLRTPCQVLDEWIENQELAAMEHGREWQLDQGSVSGPKMLRYIRNHPIDQARPLADGQMAFDQHIRSVLSNNKVSIQNEHSPSENRGAV